MESPSTAMNFSKEMGITPLTHSYQSNPTNRGEVNTEYAYRQQMASDSNKESTTSTEPLFRSSITALNNSLTNNVQNRNSIILSNQAYLQSDYTPTDIPSIMPKTSDGNIYNLNLSEISLKNGQHSSNLNLSSTGISIGASKPEISNPISSVVNAKSSKTNMFPSNFENERQQFVSAQGESAGRLSQVLSSPVNHVVLSESIKPPMSNRIVFKEATVVRTKAGDVSSQNLNRSVDGISSVLGLNGQLQQGNSSVVQQQQQQQQRRNSKDGTEFLVSPRGQSQVIMGGNNLTNCSFSSIQQQFGEFLDDGAGSTSQVLQNNSTKFSSENHHRMLALINENEKLIACNEKLIKENSVYKSSLDVSKMMSSPNEIEEEKRKLQKAIESRDVELKTLRDFIRTSSSDTSNMSMISGIGGSQVDKGIAEKVSKLESLLNVSEVQVRNLEEEKRRLNSQLQTQEQTARDQIRMMHSQGVEKSEQLLIQSNLERRNAEDLLKRELEDIKSEKVVLLHEISCLRNSNLDRSRRSASAESKELSDALKRVGDVEGNCEKLLASVKQLNEQLIEVRQEKEAIQVKYNALVVLKEESEAKSSGSSSAEIAALHAKIAEFEVKFAQLAREKEEQEQLVTSYKLMTEESQKMNMEYLHLNEAHLQKIVDLEHSVSTSNMLMMQLDQKDSYISQIVAQFESEKIMYMNENKVLVEEIKRLESNYSFEISNLKDSDQQLQKVEELKSLLAQSEESRRILIDDFEQMKGEFGQAQQGLIDELENEKKRNLESIQQLKAEVSSKSDNLIKVQQLEEERNQLLEQLEMKEQSFQQSCNVYEDRLNQEIHAHTYQLNHQLTNIKQAKHQLELDNNELKLEKEQLLREIERYRIRNQDFVQVNTIHVHLEKEMLSEQYERQIQALTQQNDRIIQNLRAEKDRDSQFLQKEHARMQQLLQEKVDVISKISSIQASQQNNSATATSGTSSNRTIEQQQYLQTQQQQQQFNRRNLSSQQLLLNSDISSMNNEVPHYLSTIKRNSQSNSNLYSQQVDHSSSFVKNAQQQYSNLMNRQDLRANASHSSSINNNNNNSSGGLHQNYAEFNQNSYTGAQEIPRYDSSIVDENDMLNKMILERCRNIVEGKSVTPQAPTGAAAGGIPPKDQMRNVKSPGQARYSSLKSNRQQYD